MKGSLSFIRLGFSLIGAAVAFGQSPAFDVATVKVITSAPTGEGRERESIETSPVSLLMRNINLQSCVRWAWGVKDYQVQGPAWTASAKYEITARTGAPVTENDLRAMLQSLLGERFGLALHRETRELPVYALIVANGRAPKLKPSASTGNPLIRADSGSFVFENVSMSDFADRLASLAVINRPVQDQTGIKGAFDLKLTLAEDNAGLKRATIQGDGPSIFTVLQEQLGLKLDPRKGPVEFLIIDRAEKTPVEN
jgi:uncharacterized protein (TIGR03435 family)